MELYSNYTQYLVAVDCIVFGYDIIEKELKLLLIKRSFDPDERQLVSGRGFVEEMESLDDAASRILWTLTGLDEDLSEAVLHLWRKRQRSRVKSNLNCILRTYSILRDIDRNWQNEMEAHWRSIAGLPDLIFDHSLMVNKALSDLQNQIKAKPVGFELLPEKFTLVQLQDLYEAIYQKQIDKRNFRKRFLSMGILEKLDEKERETSKKGAYYYKFNKDKYEKLEQNGFYFNLDVN